MAVDSKNPSNGTVDQNGYGDYYPKTDWAGRTIGSRAGIVVNPQDLTMQKVKIEYDPEAQSPEPPVTPPPPPPPVDPDPPTDPVDPPVDPEEPDGPPVDPVDPDDGEPPEETV